MISETAPSNETALFEGLYDKNEMIKAFEEADYPAKEGYELRLKNGFRVFDMGKSIAKCVVQASAP